MGERWAKNGNDVGRCSGGQGRDLGWPHNGVFLLFWFLLIRGELHILEHSCCVLKTRPSGHRPLRWFHALQRCPSKYHRLGRALSLRQFENTVSSKQVFAGDSLSWHARRQASKVLNRLGLMLQSCSCASPLPPVPPGARSRSADTAAAVVIAVHVALSPS